MTKNLNETVLEKILTLIPENIKPVNFFMDVLDLGKESAYRRLRGEKALSFEDVSKLSIELGFSLDEILENSKSQTAVFNYFSEPDQEPEKGISEFLHHSENYLRQLSVAENSRIVFTMNHLLYNMFHSYDVLFKFTYYRWMHQMKEVPLNYHFSDVTIPTEIQQTRGKIVGLESRLKNTTYIVDNNLFLNMVKEIQYFFMRGLITADELNSIKREFIVYMDRIEKTMKRGVDHSGNDTEIYLSMFNIDSNTMYVEADDFVESSFWNFFGHPVRTRNHEITSRHKVWIDSLKKYSTMISRSNELVQADFFNQQRKYINEMAENMLI